MPFQRHRAVPGLLRLILPGIANPSEHAITVDFVQLKTSLRLGISYFLATLVSRPGHVARYALAGLEEGQNLQFDAIVLHLMLPGFTNAAKRHFRSGRV